jgi:hypothetical protein
MNVKLPEMGSVAGAGRSNPGGGTVMSISGRGGTGPPPAGACRGGGRPGEARVGGVESRL